MLILTFIILNNEPTWYSQSHIKQETRIVWQNTTMQWEMILSTAAWTMC